MIPTLKGRWHTRIFLMATLGLAVTILFMFVASARLGRDAWLTPLWVLLAVTGLGLGWDVAFHAYTATRWERDWPPAQALAGGVLEGILAYLVARHFWQVPLGFFAAHYACVWLTTYLVAQGPLRILFPTWRYRGGEIW